jgi:hypothetical protein
VRKRGAGRRGPTEHLQRGVLTNLVTQSVAQRVHVPEVIEGRLGILVCQHK